MRQRSLALAAVFPSGTRFIHLGTVSLARGRLPSSADARGFTATNDLAKHGVDQSTHWPRNVASGNPQVDHPQFGGQSVLHHRTHSGPDRAGNTGTRA